MCKIDNILDKLEKIAPKRQKTVSVKNLISTLQASYNTMPTFSPTVLRASSIQFDLQ